MKFMGYQGKNITCMYRTISSHGSSYIGFYPFPLVFEAPIISSLIETTTGNRTASFSLMPNFKD